MRAHVCVRVYVRRHLSERDGRNIRISCDEFSITDCYTADKILMHVFKLKYFARKFGGDLTGR